MSTRARKRQKTDPSPVKPDKTLWHFFSKPFLGGNGKTELSPPKSESDSSSLNDEPPRSDIGAFSSVSVKQEMTPPRISNDGNSMEALPMEFEASFTEADDNCSPTKEEEIDDPFDQVDFRDDELRDEDFRENEMDFPYDDVDDIEDDFENIKSEVKEEPSDSSVDDTPSCPFCNFSFRGLNENVFSPYFQTNLAYNAACQPLSR